MSDLMPIKIKEQSNGQQLGGEEPSSLSSKMVEFEKIENTPFSIVKLLKDTEDQKLCFISIGNKRVTEFITEKEARNRIKTKDWELMVSLITVVNEALKEEPEEPTDKKKASIENAGNEYAK